MGEDENLSDDERGSRFMSAVLENLTKMQREAVDNFAEKVKERLQLHKECEYSDNKDEDEGFKSGIGWAIKEIDNTLKEKEED